MKDLRVSNKNAIAAYDPRKTKLGAFGMYPVLMREFKRDKSNGSAVFCLFYDLISELLWSDLRRDQDEVKAWTRPINWKFIAEQCGATEQMVRAVVAHGAETDAIAIHPVGDSYQFALRPENWKEAKVFVCADYRDSGKVKDDGEEKGNAKVSGLSSDRVVVMPGRSHPITLGEALHVREKLFEGIRDNQAVRLEFHSAVESNVEAWSELVAGAIHVHVGKVDSEKKANVKVSGLTSRHNGIESRDLFETLCLTIDACGRPVPARMKAEALKAWEAFAVSEQRRIVLDAGTRAQLTNGRNVWNKPEWTPTLLRYLDSKIWDAEPIAPRKLAGTAQSPDMAEFLAQLKEARGI